MAESDDHRVSGNTDPSEEHATIDELLRRIRRGDRKARKELFELLGDETRFGAVIRRMVRQLLPSKHRARRLVDTQDIVQSTLGTLLSKFSDFRGETEGELFGWLRAIVRTKINRVARRKKLTLVADDLDALSKKLGRESDRVLSAIVDQELVELLHCLIRRLSLDQRLVVELRLRGCRSPKIAEMLGLNPATVRKRESRAVEQLKTLWPEADVE